MLQSEAEKMALMRHPNLCSFMGVCLRPPCLLTGEEVQPVYSLVRHSSTIPLQLLPPPPSLMLPALQEAMLCWQCSLHCTPLHCAVLRCAASARLSL